MFQRLRETGTVVIKRGYARGVLRKDNASMASSLKRQPDRLPTISPVLTPISNPSDMLGLNFQSFEVPVDKKPKIGTLYKIDIPDGLRSLSDRPKHRLEKTNEMFDEICLVWRQINAKISDLLDQDHRFLKILIDGPRGMGKSACLLQSLDQQLKKRNSDHLGKITDEKKLIDLKSDSSDIIVFLSQINQWIAGYESYRPIEPASEGNFTQSDLAVRIMRGIGSMNPQLSEIVSELIKKSNSNDAHVQLADLFDLLKKKKCLLIADDANALFSKNTSYRSPEGKTIKTENMKVIDAVQDFAIAENTTLLTAINASDPLLPSFVPDDVAPLFTDFIKIDPLDVPETGALLNYYISKGHILKSLTRHWREKMRFCSGGNPSLLLKACAYDSVFHPE